MYYCHDIDELNEKLDQMKYPIKDEWKIIPFNEKYIDHPSFRIEFIDADSQFFKMIQNVAIEQNKTSIITCEKWKFDNFEIFLFMIGEWREKSNHEILTLLTQSFPDSKSPNGKNWTIQAIKPLREHLNIIPKDSSRDWEKWELTMRRMFAKYDILDPRRCLIIKNIHDKTFCYKEIDALIKVLGEYYLFDAKYKGGTVDSQQLQIYINILEKIGFKIKAGIFLVANDGFIEKHGVKIYSISDMTFSIIFNSKNEEEVGKYINNLIKLVEDYHRRK